MFMVIGNILLFFALKVEYGSDAELFLNATLVTVTYTR